MHSGVAGQRFTTLFISLVIFIMTKFNWYERNITSQILKIQLASDIKFEKLFDKIFVKYTDMSDLISVDTVQSGSMTELVYNVQIKKKADKQTFLSDIKKLNDILY